MHLTSPYPRLPGLPEANAYYTFFKRPEQAEWPDFTLHIDARTGQRRKYSEFVKRIEDLATSFATPTSRGGLGFKEEGELVGIFSENCMDYITVIHSCLIVTSPFSLISGYSTPFELRHALSLAKVTRLFVDAKLLPKLLPVAKEIGIPTDKIYLLLGNAPGFRTISELVDHINEKQIPFSGVRPAKNDTLAYLVFSSGTTGLPKAVMISHGNVIYSAVQSAIVFQDVADSLPPVTPRGIDGVNTSLAYLPMHHSYGLHRYCLQSFIAPHTLVIMGKWDIKVALQCIQKYEISSLYLTPSIIHQLVNHSGIETVDFSNIQAFGSGAAHLPLELAKKLGAMVPKDAIFLEGEFLNRRTVGAIIQPPTGALGGKVKIIPGSTGVLMPGVEARLLREDGSSVGLNETGELWIKSKTIALGYWNNEKANKETFINGWLKTGDQLSVNEQGCFFFADRVKDTLKVSGTQVSPLEIETVLLANPKKLINDVSVAGVDGYGRTSDEKVPHAWIVLSKEGEQVGAKAVIKELDDWHKENLSKYKWLRGGFEVMAELPKSPTGKTLRRELQDRYEERRQKRTDAKL
ncbi:hypothetical protein AGABI1DRAFT_65577 [Agaricus bisporus var. burnettii JB137-S8]|uniref:Uncharacterized protein n=1 Tax=Agaricus bisporus var. burnettii (strain JB137-S8 / ATCC MYA-4627 / FGSC 10392) TaxID=597362 RepID=K5XIW2_AGABU|nr:uncharacterized protein AGABI1DRAFT_65577 [Agaricus bisporus var. burnettii JB137-S8]EKM74390.1 hypothetical protein AGABI1DRAFT_65577 [Agaricus bisporus var. burnettii JB137-S8]